MKVRQGYPSAATLARLDAERKRYGLTLQHVADEASKTSTRARVSIQTVSRVLHARTKSANVVATVRRLIAVAKARLAA